MGDLEQLPAALRDTGTVLLPPASFLLEISFASCARKISQGVMWAGKGLNTQMPRSISNLWVNGKWFEGAGLQRAHQRKSKAGMRGAASKLSILKAKVCQEIPSPLLRVCTHADFFAWWKSGEWTENSPRTWGRSSARCSLIARVLVGEHLPAM